MLIPKFKIGADERIYISPADLCNGRWLIKKQYAKHKVAPKELGKLLDFKEGCYTIGIKNGMTDDKLPDINAIIPIREGYRLLNPEPVGVQFNNRNTMGEIQAYLYETKEMIGDIRLKVGISPTYVPLMRMGYCFAKEKTAPILILDGDTLNGDLIGLIMPIRI